jgi:hypothetical protein
MAFYDNDTVIVQPDAANHAIEVTKVTRIRFSSLMNIDYPKGLYASMEDFFAQIGNLAVLIKSIHYENGHLHLSFEMYKQRREILVWHQLVYLQAKVSRTCSNCGNLAFSRVHGSKLVVKCSNCLHAEEKADGTTGTWLDKY